MRWIVDLGFIGMLYNMVFNREYNMYSYKVFFQLIKTIYYFDGKLFKNSLVFCVLVYLYFIGWFIYYIYLIDVNVYLYVFGGYIKDIGLNES